jgi:hypothetical protein
LGLVLNFAGWRILLTGHLIHPITSAVTIESRWRIDADFSLTPNFSQLGVGVAQTFKRFSAVSPDSSPRNETWE